MKKTLVITSAAALAALMMIVSAPAFAGVSLSIGLNLPIAPGVRIGASIGHPGYGRGYRVLPPPPRVLLPAPVIYAAPVAYYPPVYAAPVVYSRPLVISAPPRRVFRAAPPPPRWGSPRPNGPIGFSAPGDKRRG